MFKHVSSLYLHVTWRAVFSDGLHKMCDVKDVHFYIAIFFFYCKRKCHGV